MVIDKDGRERTGYYWLAAEWSNLLPSCIDCNRERYHEDALTQNSVLLGKANYFPIKDENKRATIPDGEAHEDPLLLNPCIDYPDRLLRFGKDGFVRPVVESTGQTNEKAAISIHVYGLNRGELVRSRREIIRLLEQRMYTITQSVLLLDEVETNQKFQDLHDIHDLLEDLLGHELAWLDQFADPDKPFSLMARQLIDEFMGTLTR
jgi:hypothetical protein